MKKYGVWEQPKNGSENGYWSYHMNGGQRIPHLFDTLEAAQKKANDWNANSNYQDLHHEAREYYS